MIPVAPILAVAAIAGATFLLIGSLSRRRTVKRGFVPYRLEPGSPEQIRVFEQGARMVGLPVSWASDPGLIKIVRAESDGWVGIPNYEYGERMRDKSRWAEVHEELRRQIQPPHSSATGLGQLKVSNVDAYYPAGRAGIGIAEQEAAGMLGYIRKRYGTPSEAWRCYGKICYEYGKTFLEGY